MAQIVKLKRTSVSGKVPTISNIELGELAMNTYDGRIFFEKNDGSATIQEILTTNAGRAITGSININGAITASYFKGDGSALTNIQATVSEQVTVTSSFESESTIDVAHNFSSKNVIVSVYDSNDNQIIPQTVSLTDTDNVRVVLSSAQSGFVVVAKGGHIVSGSADDSNRLNGQLASYYLNYNNFTNVPSGLVSGSSQIDVTQTTNYSSINQYSDTKVKTKLNTEGVISGSSQITLSSVDGYNSQEHLNHTLVSITAGNGLTGGGTIALTRTIAVGAGDGISVSADAVAVDGTVLRTTGDGVVSGSVLRPNGDGVISGSSQVNADSITNFDTNVKSKLDAENVLSGSSHSGDQTFDDNVIVTGNLTVNGTTTSVNSNTVNIGDNIIVLNSDESGTPSQDAGIEIERGTSTNVRFQFKESTDRWQFSNDGSTYFNLPTSTADVAEFSNLYYTDTRVKTKLNTEGVISGSSQVDHDATTNFVANEHIDHSTITVGSGKGLSGGGTINVSRSLTLNTGSAHFSSGVVESLPAGTVSGSSQIDVTSTTNYVAPAITDNSGTPTLVSGITAAEVRSAIGVDASGTDNSTDVTLGGSYDYITISGQTITRNQVDASTDISNLTTSNVSEGANQYYTDARVKTKLTAENVISGSAQITDLTTHKETVSGASSYAVDHNLGEQYPIVQAWNTGTSQQEVPTSITTNSVNRVTVVFSSTFAGIIIVKK